MVNNSLIEESTFLAVILLVTSTIVVLFIPFGIQIDLGPGPNSLVSIIWELSLEQSWYTIRYFTGIKYYFLFDFFRIIFLGYIIFSIFVIYNERKLIKLSVISEVIPLVLSIPGFLFRNADGDNLSYIILPTPFLILYTLIIILILRKSKFKNEYYASEDNES